MRILAVLGTRPQAVRAGPLARAFAAAGHEEILLPTGQHYDPALGAAPAGEAVLPSLGVGSASHGVRTAAIAAGVAAAARECRPAAILAAGDTDSALGAGLGARAAGVPLVHGEAGVRLGSLDLPEEAHRIVLDHLCDLALCPTERAAASLRAERPRGAVVAAGDPLLDALPPGPPAAPASPPRFLATLHRAGNADDPRRLRALLGALDALPHPVDLPLHPRTRRALDALGPIPTGGSLRVGPPLPHGELVALLRGATAVFTDSGGVQREAYWLGVPCIVLRESCEWRETVEEGWAVLAGADPVRIAAAAAAPPRGGRPPDRAAFGGGRAAARWVGAMAERYG